MVRILVVDNYDSFVYNIVSYLGQLGADVDVWRNDDARFGQVVDLQWSDVYDGVLLSPGPGTPDQAGVCGQIVDTLLETKLRLPVFGVCLGLQVLCTSVGALVERAPAIVHGKTSAVHHDGAGVFAGLPNPLTATRYHSLAANPAMIPEELEVTARTDDGIIMAVRHRDMPMEAVQFHPESVLTEGGYQMLANWLVECGDPTAGERAVGLSPLMSPSAASGSSRG